MSTQRNRPGTAEGTGTITSLTANRTSVRLDSQSNDVIYDDLFGHVVQDPALDVLCVESAGDLEKSELLRQASEAAFAHVVRLRERGSTVSPAQVEKYLLTMLNELIAAHNKETRDHLPRYRA